MSLTLTPVSWQVWCLAILALGMFMAVDWDLREQRIPNALILFLMLSGLAMQTLGPANGRGGLFDFFPGAVGLGSALLGALVGLSLFLPFYILKAMGAGDIKLMAALGVFVGPADVIGLALFVLVAGGVLCVIRMLIKRNTKQVLGNVKTILGGIGQGGSRFDVVTQSADRMPYALSFATGLAVFGYWRLSGGQQILGF
jgi:prepilin peptidase CpaA